MICFCMVTTGNVLGYVEEVLVAMDGVIATVIAATVLTF